jgi:hypothetical protein
LLATIISTIFAGINFLRSQKAEIVQRIQRGNATLADINALLDEANQLKLKADKKYAYKPKLKYDDRWSKDQDIAFSIDNYRWALRGINSGSIQNSKSEFYLKQAKNSLGKILSQYRISKLEEDLKFAQRHRDFGDFIKGKKLTDFGERYTESPLKTTYNLLMREFGVAADFNDDGELQENEANQIPCLTLDEIEKLWRFYTENHCGWYGYRNPDKEYVNNDCHELKQETIHDNPTLLRLLFVPIDYGTDRLKKCLPELG